MTNPRGRFGGGRGSGTQGNKHLLSPGLPFHRWSLSHLTVTINFGDKHAIVFHRIDEETNSETLCHLPKVIQ